MGNDLQRTVPDNTVQFLERHAVDGQDRRRDPRSEDVGPELARERNGLIATMQRVKTGRAERYEMRDQHAILDESAR